MDELTDTEAAVLAFEGQRWRYQGVKDAAIRETFGWSPTRHYQVVGALLEKPAAEVAAPALVRRLRRVRDARRRIRST